MRSIIYLLLLVLTSCSCRAVVPVKPVPPVHDTVYVAVHDTVRLDRVLIARYENEQKRLMDSLRNNRRTMADVRNAFFAQDMRHYLSLCEQRPANWKYFKGWTIRAIRRLNVK